MYQKSLLTISAVALLNINAYAGGFQIAEQGTKAMAMSNAFTAVADDPSAQWYNPAGSAFLSGTQVMAGGDYILVPGMDFKSNNLNPTHPSTTQMKRKTLVVPTIYLTHQYQNSPLTAGIGINAPFGLSSDWPTNSPFAISNTFSEVKTVNINPNVSWRINDHWAVAAGVDYVNLLSVHLNNTVQSMSGKGDGWGGNVAMMYRNDQLSFGVSYRSRVRLDIKNGTVVGGPALAFLGAPSAVGATGAVSTKIVLPDQLNAGVAWRPNGDWLLSLDVDWVNWKTFDNLDFHYAPSFVGSVITGGTYFRTLPENWHATTAVRLGAQWQTSTAVSLRAGYTYDPTPIDPKYYSPGIPGRDRQLFTVGAGYRVSDALSIDVGYMLVYFKDRYQTASTGPVNATRNGTYTGNVHVFSGSVVYKF